MKKIIFYLLILSAFQTFGQGTGIPYPNYTTSGPLGTAAATIDMHTHISIDQTTPGITLTVPQPTSLTNPKNITINNAGTAEFLIIPGGHVPPGTSIILRWSGIWQVSGVGAPAIKDSLHKYYGITPSGYARFKYLDHADMPDSISQDKLLGLNLWKDSVRNAMDAKLDSGYANLVMGIIMQNVNAKEDSGSFYTKHECDSLYQPKGSFVSSESDPVFIGSTAYGINGTNTGNWNVAYSWGDHSGLYSLLGHTHSISDVVGLGGTLNTFVKYSDTPAILLPYAKSVDHFNKVQSDARYLQSFTELDPVFLSSAAFGVSSGNIMNWNNAYGWGNHASAGYFLSSNFNATGDARYALLSGSYANPTFITSIPWAKITGAPSFSILTATDAAIASPISGNVLKYNGLAWANATLTGSDVGLPNVNNTSDINKPVSTAQQAAINAVVAGAVPYKSYHALVSQVGTSAPSASRKDTSFSGVTFTWARSNVGIYTLTASSGVFTSGKTVVIMGLENAPMQKFAATVTSTSVITINTNVQSVGLISLLATLLSNGTDGMLSNTLVEVRVYN